MVFTESITELLTESMKKLMTLEVFGLIYLYENNQWVSNCEIYEV